MGRRKKTGKHRRSTGSDTAAEFTLAVSAAAVANTGVGAGATGEIDLAPDLRVMENTVTDASIAQLEAEANAALAAAPVPLAPDGSAPLAPEYDPNAVTEWDPYMQMAVEVMANIGVPQWNLNPHEKNELTKSLAHILEQLYPGGLSGKFAPYLRLITVCGVITFTRVSENGGKLPGFGPKKIEPIKPTEAAAQP